MLILRKLSKIIVSCFLVVIFLVPFNVIASSIDDYSFNKKMELVDPYLIQKQTPYGSTYFIFDEEKAKKENMSDDIIKAGHIMEDISKTFAIESDSSNPANAKYESSLRGVPIKCWGKYCGPSYSGDNFHQDPQDILDARCMEHDKCYARHKYFTCSCNRDLVNYIDNNISRMDDTIPRTWGLTEKGMARYIRNLFEKLPCKEN